MVIKLIILLTLIQTHRGSSTPLRQFREAKAAHAVPLLIPHQSTSQVTHHQVLITPTTGNKNPNLISIPISQILVPKLHVVPISQSNIHHSTIHTDVKHIITNENIKIPIISHTISHSSANITHPTPSIPILISYPHNVLPIHDLSVIPLQKTIHTVQKIDPNLGHYRIMEKKDDELVQEPVNILRTVYGGFGTGLYFGGQGAGHGFHVFGK